MAKASRAEWVKRVERREDSGLTAKEFATELAVSRNSLNSAHARRRSTSISLTRDRNSLMSETSRPRAGQDLSLDGLLTVCCPQIRL